MSDTRERLGEEAWLVLADGTAFEAEAFGADVVGAGEVVFTTGMTGYEEVLTDPSYTGQLVTMTAPQIGNTGITHVDAESQTGAPTASGLVVREASALPSSHRSRETLHDYLTRHGVPAVTGVDTRRLTRHLRDHGSQNGAFGRRSRDELLRVARALPSMEGLDLVSRVTPREAYEVPAAGPVGPGRGAGERELHVVALDFGMKQNIVRCLAARGVRTTVVPAGTSAADVLALAPDGVFLSNGPGDPAALPHVIAEVRALLGKRPLFGICLGHQLLALALGGKTFKLKFGHRGINQPVLDLATGRVEITSQNHGFCVDVASLGGRAEPTHVHLNDQTSEGLAVPSLGAFSVQYHPESAAGPHDSGYLFDRFVARMRAPSQGAA
jgi:carbamoyl-phosphate synthase small subunit